MVFTVTMGRLCFLVVITLLNSFVSTQDNGLSSYFVQSGIVPDVLSVAPAKRMTVQYPNGTSINPGDVLKPSQVKDIPTVAWDFATHKFYTLVKIDPDAPSREKPTFREMLHWLVVNIPGNNVTSGDTIAEFIGAGPPKNTGLHRYVFLVYEQPNKIMFNEPRTTNRSRANRPQFSVTKFAKKYNMSEPIAGSFFQAEWDAYVPILQQQLSGGQPSLNSNMIALIGLMMLLTLMK